MICFLNTNRTNLASRCALAVGNAECFHQQENVNEVIRNSWYQ